VSDDLVKIVQESSDYSNLDMIKQLARVPDNQVAAAVVELWTKQPILLKETIPALGTRAEEPLWQVLASTPNLQLRVDACQFLAQQGTQKSIQKLATIAHDKNENRSVAEAADKAMKSLGAK
jgi:HEAT repeat protein